MARPWCKDIVKHSLCFRWPWTKLEIGKSHTNIRGQPAAFSAGGSKLLVLSRAKSGFPSPGVLYGYCLVTWLCPALRDPMACSLPDSLPMGFLMQEYWSEWVAVFFSRPCSRPRDWNHISCLAGRFCIVDPPAKPLRGFQHPTAANNFRRIKLEFWKRWVPRSTFLKASWMILMSSQCWTPLLLMNMPVWG